MEEDVKEALKIVTGSGDVEDRFPVSGVLGGAWSGRSRDIGESVYQKHGVTHHSHHGALDAQRRADALDAVRRVGFVAGPAPAGRRLTKQERKQIAFDAQAAASGFSSMTKRGRAAGGERCGLQVGQS
jgi:hypothetical protein